MSISFVYWQFFIGALNFPSFPFLFSVDLHENLPIRGTIINWTKVFHGIEPNMNNTQGLSALRAITYEI